MPEKKLSQFGLIGKSWAKSFDIVIRSPKIMLPFAIMAVLELIGLFLIFIAEQPPFVKHITPLILRFWGEQFLHYPFNLLLLSKLFYYLQLTLGIILGTFMSGVTINAVWQYCQKKTVSLISGSKQALVKYVSLLIITIIVLFVIEYVSSLEKNILLKIIMKESSFLGIDREDWTVLFIMFRVVVGGILQGLFIFAQPAIMIDNKNFIAAIFRNLLYVFKNLFAACTLVVLPLCLYIPISILKVKIFPLMKRTCPEVVFVVLIAGVFISVFINVFITVSTTKCYLLIRGEHNEQR